MKPNWFEIPPWAEDFARSILESLRVRDPYTANHCMRVGYYSKMLARAAGLSPFEQTVVEYSGIFHDVGKIGVPDEILNKPGRLSPEEDAIMQQHPLKSVQIISPLAHVPFFRSTLPGIRHHHERIDGHGYPDKVKGDLIPLTARIILVVDTYDAMTSNRIYRKGLPSETAYKELQTFAGRQFDDNLVKIFLDAHPTWGQDEEEETTSDKIVTNLFRKVA